MTAYRFDGPEPRYYPDRGLFASAGEVHDLDSAPDDGRWVPVDGSTAAAGPAAAAVVAPAAPAAPSTPSPDVQAAEAAVAAAEAALAAVETAAAPPVFENPNVAPSPEG